MSKILFLLLPFAFATANEISTNKKFVQLFNTISPKAQKSVKSFLFQACAFGKIKKDTPKTANIIIKTAYNLWEETLTYAELKLQFKIKPSSSLQKQKMKAKQKYQEMFNELQKILPSQSRHFFESSDIIKIIKDTANINLTARIPQKLRNHEHTNEESWGTYLKKTFNTILSFIKNIFKTTTPITEKTTQQIQQPDHTKRLAVIDLIKYAITSSQNWIKDNPKASYKKSPFCLLKQVIAKE